MNTKIIIIHAADIISHGLYGIIKKKFNIDAIVLSSPESLPSYKVIANFNIIFIVDAGLFAPQFLQSIQSFRDRNSVKIILIHESKKDLHGKFEYDGSFTINSTTDQIIELLNPLLFHNQDDTNKKKSSGLTERETDVLKLVAFGKTNKDIADELYISIHTVVSHRKNITEKLGIKSISGLTVFAILNDLIDTTALDPDSLI